MAISPLIRQSKVLICGIRVLGHARRMSTLIKTEDFASSSKVEEKAAREVTNKTLKRSFEPDQIPSFPVSGIFGIVKPSGPSSMQILDKLKPMLGKKIGRAHV